MGKGWKVFVTLSIIMTLVSTSLIGLACFGSVTSVAGSTNIKIPNIDKDAFLDARKAYAESSKNSGEVKVFVPETSDLLSEVTSKSGDGVLYVLALGVDSRGDDLVGRSDSIIVLRIDKLSKKVDLVSIPRDAYVDIVGKGKHDKITHAFAYGGEEMAQKTVENLLGIQFDYHVVFNFKSFMSVIDVLGGVDVDVPFSFTEQNSKGKADALSFQEGPMTLNGEQALAYARMRHQDPKGDIGRGERQQQVIKAVVSKLLSMESISKYADVYKKVTGSMETDVQLYDVVGLSSYLTSFKNVDSHLIEGEGKKINGVYYMEVDQTSLANVKSMLKDE